MPIGRGATPRAANDDGPGWGLGATFAGWFTGFFLTVLVGGSVIASGSWNTHTPPGVGGQVATSLVQDAVGSPLTHRLPMALESLLTVPLWIGMMGVALWATTTLGRGLVQDLRLTMQLIDIPIGIAVGLFSQLVLLWVVYQPFRPIIDLDKIDDEARAITDRIDTNLALVVVSLVVGLGAPLVEEIFFRGMLYRALGRRFGAVVSIVASSLLFAAVHFQLIQFIGLFAFGVVLALLVQRFDRLGPAIWAHIAFNVTTLVVLIDLP